MKLVELELHSNDHEVDGGELLGNDHELDGGGPLHPKKDDISRFLNKGKEEGSTLRAVPSALSSFNISKFP